MASSSALRSNPSSLLIGAIVLILVLSCSVAASASRAPTSTSRSDFIVQGRVFCDPCRAGFETQATNYLSGVKVRVECRKRKTGEVTYEAEGVTDATGTYHIPVANDHQLEICEAVLLKSPEINGCSQMVLGRERAQVVLTHNDGIPSSMRFANNMGFQTYTPMSGCSELMKMYQPEEEDVYVHA